MEQIIVIESLAMDLKRVALGLQRGSSAMADRFKEESLKRIAELENQNLNLHLKKLVQGIKKVLAHDGERVAEDALMYSVLFQNVALRSRL